MKIYYIETDLDGNVYLEKEISEWNKNKDYIESLFFTHEDVKVNYYKDISKSIDDLDTFLANGNWLRCPTYQNELDTPDNVYLEYKLTKPEGKLENKYIGLMIK